MAQCAVGEIVAAEKDIALVDDHQFGMGFPRRRIKLYNDPLSGELLGDAMVGLGRRILAVGVLQEKTYPHTTLGRAYQGLLDLVGAVVFVITRRKEKHTDDDLLFGLGQVRDQR